MPTPSHLDPLADPHESRHPEPRLRASASEVVRGTFVAFVVAAVLGSGLLVDLAERQPFGWQRDVLVGGAGALDRVTNLLSLNRPVDWALDRRDDGPSAEAVELLDEARERELDAADTRPALRTVTAAEPLELYVGGDSMVRELGAAMKGVVADEPATSNTDFRVISGLTRDDYFDWPAHLAEVVDAGRPEAMVVMFGANDFQGIRTDDGEVFDPGTAGWIAEYRSRVALVMDLLDQPGTTLHWVGLPIMRSSTFSANARVLNDIYREEASSRSWVTYVSTFEEFADDGGAYAAFLEVDGSLEPMRQDDGIHWSSPGATRAARHVFDAVADAWRIGP